MSTVTIPARPGDRPTVRRSRRSGRPADRARASRPALRAAPASSCRGTATALRVLPDGSVRIPPAALRDAARRAAAPGRAGAPGTPVHPRLAVAFAPAPVDPVAPAPVRPPRVSPSSPLRLVPTPGPAAGSGPAGGSGPVGAPGPTTEAATAGALDAIPARLREAPRRVGIRPVAPLPLRLTRRGRLLRTLLATAILVSALVAVAGAVRPLPLHGLSVTGLSRHASSVLGAGSAPVSSRRVTVRPGDTLWAIAERAAPGADPRDTVAAIEAVNHLSSSDVEAGTVLRVPAGR